MIVLDRIGMLRSHVLIEGAAYRHVEKLRAATDCKHRLPIGQRPTREQQLRPVARRVGPAAQLGARLIVGGWIDIDAARQKQPVEPLIDRP